MARPRRAPPPLFTPPAPPAGHGEPTWRGYRIPRPPSLNRLYRNIKDRKSGQRGRAKTISYTTWMSDAGFRLVGQPALPQIDGRYELVILLGRRKGSDLDNYAKAVSDWLKLRGAVADDSLCEALSLRWCDRLTAKQAYFYIREAPAQAEGLAHAA